MDSSYYLLQVYNFTLSTYMSTSLQFMMCKVGSLPFLTTLWVHVASYIPRNSLMVCFPSSSHLPWSSPICTRLNFPFTSVYQRPYLTMRQNLLYVTTGSFARPILDRYFTSPLGTPHYCCVLGLANGLLGNYPCQTITGKCGTASLDHTA